VKRMLAKMAMVGLPAVVALVAAVPSSAQASVSPRSSTADCPSGYLCFWVDANWVGKMGKVAGNNGSWTNLSESTCKGGTWNDCASALFNNGAVDNARVFKDANGKGGGRCVVRGTKWSNLTAQYFDNGVKMNDQISSNDWVSSACS
jgi:hypothetical protein